MALSRATQHQRRQYFRHAHHAARTNRLMLVGVSLEFAATRIKP
jgi:hypothetical protein